MPRFMVSMVGDESFITEATPEMVDEIVAAMDDFNKQLEDAGVFVQGDGLAPSATATTLRFGAEGKPVPHDGPFAETKEQIAGYWILDCKDQDEAVSWASKAPIKGGAIEVRAIAEGAQENVDAFKEQSKDS